MNLTQPLSTFVLLVGFAAVLSADELPRRPDVLFLVVDDLNDWISLLDPESPIQTPNLQRLANRGTLFTRAYCVSPACNPSRVATLTGLRPSTTGVYGNRSDWRAAMPNRPTIFERFKGEGYDVFGAGKIFHHHLNGAFHDERSFDEFQPMSPQLYPPIKLGATKSYGSKRSDWGVWPPSEEQTIDFATTQYCVDKLNNMTAGDPPTLLACGIYKPHSPFYAPAKYHRPYQKIGLPKRLDDDWADLPNGAEKLMSKTRWFWRGMEKIEEQRPGAYQAFIRSYAACVHFADAQIGRILDALDKSARGRNTAIVLWSDHGFHLGEKDHIEKFALWEKSNHVPLIMVLPGVTRPGSICDATVDLSVIYPTLCEVAGTATGPCDGQSVMPLLQDPQSAWDTPAVMTFTKGNHAVRSKRYRYIRYDDQSEELYDHNSDPLEWANLAGQASAESIMAEHRRWIPSDEANQVPDLRIREKRVLFANGADGYNNFRIPAIVRASNGDLLAFCEARSGGDAGLTDLVLRRSVDDGKTWKKFLVVGDHRDFKGLYRPGRSITVGNPAPVVDALDPQHPGRIWLAHTVENDRVFVMHSDDHGFTWSTSREVTADVKLDGWGWYATGPVHGIQLQSQRHRGRLVIPCDHRLGQPGRDQGDLGAHLIYSDDHGATWKLGAVDDSYSDPLNANETTLVELADGRLYINTRDQNGKSVIHRGETLSKDGGETFEAASTEAFESFVPSTSVLDTPVVQSCLLRVQTKINGQVKDMVLFSGPDQNGPSGEGRSDLRIRYSLDSCGTWDDGPLIHRGPAAYSGMVDLGQGRVGILFEAGDEGKPKYDSIVFTILETNKMVISR
ncbi:MAG: sulfatase-like hydrolase/transferase [Planctomycetota bacterium]